MNGLRTLPLSIALVNVLFYPVFAALKGSLMGSSSKVSNAAATTAALPPVAAEEGTLEQPTTPERLTPQALGLRPNTSQASVQQQREAVVNQASPLQKLRVAQSQWHDETHLSAEMSEDLEHWLDEGGGLSPKEQSTLRRTLANSQAALAASGNVLEDLPSLIEALRSPAVKATAVKKDGQLINEMADLVAIKLSERLNAPHLIANALGFAEMEKDKVVLARTIDQLLRSNARLKKEVKQLRQELASYEPGPLGFYKKKG
jgi:hypothetical protein